MPHDIDTGLSRRSRKKLETRRKIYQSALELMSIRGYDEVAITEICEHADVANATFYLHFPTKASLINALNDEVAENVAAELEGFGGSSVEKLELLRASLANEWMRNGPLLLHILGELAAQPKATSSLDASFQGLSEIITGIIVEGQANGDMRTQLDAGIIARTILAAWNAVMLQVADGADLVWAGRANRQALDLILYGAVIEQQSGALKTSAAG